MKMPGLVRTITTMTRPARRRAAAPELCTALSAAVLLLETHVLLAAREGADHDAGRDILDQVTARFLPEARALLARVY